jgi:RecG-like helicase
LASKLNEFDVESLLVNIPFELTGEQLSVIEQVLYQFHSRKVLNGTLIGDVGTGKTGITASFFQYLCRPIYRPYSY